MAHEWLRKSPPKHWSRSQFSGRTNCDLLINNICEVFNRQLLEAKDSPVITALEYVREYFKKRIVIVQKVIEKSQGPLTPTVTKIFNAIKEKASQCVVVWNGAELFQVNEGIQNHVVVNLANRSCTCRKWEVSGIPCKHAVACIFNMNDNGMQVGAQGTSVAGSGSASGAATQLVMTSATQPARAKQPQRQPPRAASQPASASVSTPKPTRQTKTNNVVASGSHGAKKTPIRQSQRQKAAKKTPTTK
ncbi:mutator type transposase [Tanacetum coccineum]